MEQFQIGIPLFIKSKNIDDFPVVLKNILDEAKHRWLEPGEVLQILNDHEKLHPTVTPPLLRPPVGSVILYDSARIGDYLNDGYEWMEENEDRLISRSYMVNENSVECLFSYRKGDEGFERRIYSKDGGHLKFVHYLKVIEQTLIPVEDIGSSSGHTRNIDVSAAVGLTRVCFDAIASKIKFDASLPRSTNQPRKQWPTSKPRIAKPIGAKNNDEESTTTIEVLNIAPEWAHTDTTTMVLIAGRWLTPNKKDKVVEWVVKAGRSVLRAECIGDVVVRFQIPAFTMRPGKVRMCLMSKDGGEVSNKWVITFAMSPQALMDMNLQFFKALYSVQVKRQSYICVESECGKCQQAKESFSSLLNEKQPNNSKQEDFIRDQLYELLVSGIHQTYEFFHEFDDTGKSIVHHLMGLGCYWAINPLKAAGIDLTRGDGNKKLPVDYAVEYGRSETVAMLRDETMAEFSSLMRNVGAQQ